MAACAACGYQAARGVPVLPRVRERRRRTSGRAAQGRDRALLRRRRLDRARRVGRPGGAAGAARPLLRADEGDRRAPRRHGREVHRRRGDGGLRRAGRCTRTTRCGPAGRRSRCATRLPELGVEGRIGVNTGEVVTGTEERLATGDAVNVAARLRAGGAAGRDADRRDDARARRATRSRSSRSSRSS